MSNNVFLFPAFVLKYKGDEIKNIIDSEIDFYEKLKYASEIAGVDLTSFDISENNFMDDELKNQLITYIISCLYSDILKAKNIFPKQITFLSMGVYSALYCSECISLKDGILLIKRIYDYLKNQISGKTFKMLAITGFSKEDIESLIISEKLDCQIVIKNSDYSFIVAGQAEDISGLYKKAQIEGALHQNIFPVSIPYHSKYINTDSLANSLFDKVEIKQPAYKILSSINHSRTDTTEELKAAILKNLNTFIDWHKTKTTQIKMGYNQYIECGPGDSLKRISRFINCNHKIYNLSALIK